MQPDQTITTQTTSRRSFIAETDRESDRIGSFESKVIRGGVFVFTQYSLE